MPGKETDFHKGTSEPVQRGPGPSSLRAMKGGSAFDERESDLTQAEAKFAHHRLVEHHALIHQKQPIVKLHLVCAALDRQAQSDGVAATPVKASFCA